MDRHSIGVDIGSERSFGTVFAVVFAIIGIYESWGSNDITWWAFAVALVLGLLALTYPRIFKTPNHWWFKFGLLLGSIIAPIVMALVYITTLVPMGLIIRLTGKDILRLKLDPQTDSYWIDRETPPQPMKNQF